MTLPSKFKIPNLLVELASLDVPRSEGPFAIFNLGIDRVNTDCPWCPYACTPPDVLQFAWTGGDGIHFGFLTDFGAVTDLAQAPIVCVRPASNSPIMLAARNLRDFVRILCHLKQGYVFASVQYHLSDDPWWKTFGADPTEESYEDSVRAASIVRERLDLPEMTDYRGYLMDLWAERKRSISLETKDGLGILRTSRSSDAPQDAFDFEVETNGDLEKMRAFVAHASHDATLSFCRDAQYCYDFIPGRNDAVRLLVADTLCGLGLDFEGERIRTFGDE